jgi:HlyD family secretion protein
MLATRAVSSKLALGAAAALLLAATFAGGYWYSIDSVAARYDTVLAENRSIVRVVSRTGRTVASRDETLRFGVAGIVSDVLVRPGQQVKGGDALIRLASPAAKIAADQALVSLELARLRLDDLLRQANALAVTAPMAGRVASLCVLPGETVSRGAVAAVIEDPDRWVVEVRVAEHLLPGLSPGQPVQLAFPTLPGRLAQGYITEVGASLQGTPGSATAPVKVAFRNPGGVVAGMTVLVAASVQGAGLPVSARVVAGEGQVITARDAATVTAVHAAAGQGVKAGQLLAVMENALLSVQYEQARLAYDTARQRYEAMGIYYSNPDDPLLVNVRLQYQQAKYNYDLLAERVAALRVTAPWAGTVTTIGVKPGDAVASGAVIAQLVRDKTFLVSASVPAARFAGLSIGQSMLVDLPELGIAGLPGNITRKSGQGVATGSGSLFEITVEVQARLDVIPWPGTAARVNLPAGLESFEASGTARAEQQETIRFGAAGTVSAVLVPEGAQVAAGDVMILLANESLLRDTGALGSGPLAAGTVALERAAGPSLREEILRKRSAELTYRQRIAEFDSLTVRAPYDCLISDVKVKQGDAVGAGAAGVAIVGTSGLDVLTDIGELDVGKVAIGDQMEVYLAALPDSDLTATVIEIGLEPRQTSEGALYPLRLRLSDSTGVRAGMTCVVAVVTDIRRDVLTVPVEAVQTRYGAKAVRVVLDRKQESFGTTSIQRSRVWKGNVEWVYVVTGPTDGVYIEIVKGLAPWSEVVLRERQRGTSAVPAGGR